MTIYQSINRVNSKLLAPRFNFETSLTIPPKDKQHRLVIRKKKPKNSFMSKIKHLGGCKKKIKNKKLNLWSIHLGERQRGSEINQEIRPQIPGGDGGRVDDKVAAAEDTRAGSDKGGAKLHDHVEEVEEVGDGPEEGDEDAEADVDLHAGGTADDGEVEVERVEEQGEEGGDEEDVVPLCDEL